LGVSPTTDCSCAVQIADDDQPGGNPDARLQLDGFDIKPTDRVESAQARPHCSCGVVLMRLRIAEIDEYPVAHIPGDEAVEPKDNSGDCAVVSGDDLAQILGIELRRQRCRADQIAEHHRELAAFGVAPSHVGGPRGRRRNTRRGSKRGDALEQSSAMAHQHHAEIFEIFGSQARQHSFVDLVVAERLSVLAEPQTIQPGCDVHARLA
jgi:hypothetical protein